MQDYLAMVLIVAASCAIGQALWSACGGRGWSGLSPAVGLAALIAVAGIVVRLPGDGVTAAVILLVLVLISLRALRRRRTELGRIPLELPAIAVIAAGLTALPFVASGRIGLLGESLSNDTAVHMLFADALRSDLMAHLYGIPATYPIGPHSLLAALADGTGMSLDPLLNGLVLAVPIITSLAAVEGLRRVPRVLRIPGALGVGFTYMLCAWFAQAAFKETILATFVLAFALVLQDLVRRPAIERGPGAVVLATLVAGSVQTYSYLAAGWLGGTLAGTAVLLVVVHAAGPRRALREARGAVGPALIGAIVTVVALGVEIPRLARFFDIFGTSPAAGAKGIATTNIGNLAGPLQLKETFGVWPIADFRFPPAPNVIPHQASLQSLAIVAAIAGALWCLRLRNVALPAAIITSLVIFKISDGRQSPYITAKALVVLAPLVTLASLSFLLEAWGRSNLARGWGALRWAAATVLLIAFGWSSDLQMRAAPVESGPQRDDLQALQPLVRNGATLFLGIDDFAAPRLREVHLGYGGVGTPPPIPVTIAADKPYTYTHPIDFDSIPPDELDTYRYVITVRSGYISAPPPNFHRVGGNASYDVWERRGSTPRRALLNEEPAPGKVLKCRGGRPLHVPKRYHRALVWPRVPITAASGPIPPGGVTVVNLKLPRGTWDLAMQYVSLVPLRIQLGGKRYKLPADTTRPGPFWSFARIHSPGGVVTIYVIAEKQSRLTSPLSVAVLTSVAATSPGHKRVLPVTRACGRYVDRFVG